MTHMRGWFIAVLIGSAVAGCGTNSTNNNGDDGSGPPYSGSGSAGDTGSNGGTGGSDTGSDDGADVQPTYPTQHPRIYITANKARLQAALAAHSPAATRFSHDVDSYLAGGDLYDFRPWNAALMAQLTGEAKYCTKAVAVVEAQVAAAEAAIASGSRPEVANENSKSGRVCTRPPPITGDPVL